MKETNKVVLHEEFKIRLLELPTMHDKVKHKLKCVIEVEELLCAKSI